MAKMLTPPYKNTWIQFPASAPDSSFLLHPWVVKVMAQATWLPAARMADPDGAPGCPFIVGIMGMSQTMETLGCSKNFFLTPKNCIGSQV